MCYNLDVANSTIITLKISQIESFLQGIKSEKICNLLQNSSKC